ncbi:MAG: VTT domain-containing protein, partial [candidate division WOR-3 bacterium]
MVHTVLEAIGAWIIHMISLLGYGGVILLMAIESACIPLPSEIIMPFAGTLTTTVVVDGVAHVGRYNLILVGLAGALGCLIGSTAAYWVGVWGGRPFILRYGKYVLITRHDLDIADRFFNRYGQAAIFISRLLPVVRTFISLPAGIARMPFGRFCLYSFLGSVPWCLALAWLGRVLGQNWKSLEGYFRKFDFVIGILIVAGLVWFVWRHLRRDIIVVLDRWSVHRRAERLLGRQCSGRTMLEWLPGYAPELNPVEYVWSHTKSADLANYIAEDINDMRSAVEHSIESKRSDQLLLRSFFDHAQLYL